MNRAQLDALLAANAITISAYVTALSTLSVDGTIATPPTLDLHMPAPAVRLDVQTDDEGATTGGVVSADVVTRYDELIASHGMVLHAGSMVPRQPLDRNKLLRDHDHAAPVGYMLTVDDAGQSVSWQVAATEIDRVRQEFDDKLRDGLSVGFTATNYEFDADWILHVYEADWYETSLCAIPAVSEAGVTSVAAALATAKKENTIMNRAQLAAALAAGQITQAQHDAALAALDALAATNPVPPAAPAAPVAPELAAGPDAQPAAPARTQDRGMSLRQVTEHISAAAQLGTPQAIALAIEEIIPGDDAGHAFIGRPEWIGEVWQADGPEGRPWIESFGGTKELTGTKIEGYAWDETPVPEKYEGELAEVPSNGFSTKPVSAEPERWAWAARIDRIFRDLGSPDLVAALFEKLRRNYSRVSDFDVAAKVIAAATVPAAGQPGAANLPHPTVLAAIGSIARQFRTLGAKLDQVWLSDDVFDLWATLKIADLPAWLALNLGLSLEDGKSTIGNLTIEADSKLAAGTLVGYDKRAIDLREKQPITPEALVIPNGGIDIGFFSYGGFLVNDARAIVKRKITVPA